MANPSVTIHWNPNIFSLAVPAPPSVPTCKCKTDNVGRDITMAQMDLWEAIALNRLPGAKGGPAGSMRMDLRDHSFEQAPCVIIKSMNKTQTRNSNETDLTIALLSSLLHKDVQNYITA